MWKRNVKVVTALLVVLAMVMGLCACGGEGEPSNIIIKNASVYTVDEENSVAEAVVVQDGVVEYVGDDEGAAEYEDGDSKIIDMGGNTVMPGMVDAHMHPAQSALSYYFEIGLQDVVTEEDYLQVVEDFVEENPDREVYTGSGFMRSSFDEIGPRKEALDKIVDDKPVILTSADGHSVWVNSKALELAGVTKDTENPEGGIIQKDPETGEPAGLLQESAANLVSDLKPEYTKEEYKEAITWLQGWLNERGVTTVYDGMVPIDKENYYMAYEEMAAAGELTIRVRGAWHLAPEMGDQEVLSALIDRGMELSETFTTDYFQVIGFKFFADQVLEEQTAYMSDGYETGEADWQGMKVWDDDTMEALFTKIDAAGYQIHVHQIGDAAATYTLDALEKVRAANGENGARHTFVHVQFVSDEDIQRMAELNINAIIAPYWAVMDDYYWDLYVPYVGKEKADNMYPAESLVKAGLNVGVHSDFFVTEPDLGWVLYSAVTRTLPQKVFDLWYEGMDLTRTTETDVEQDYLIGPLKPYDERMSMDEIVKAATYGGAYSMFLEDQVGSIQKGMKADLVLLDQNVFKADIEDVSNVVPVMTIFDGKITYEIEE
ncbi:MAG: amidohydrolase [Bacillota bacterium]|nr:amidohydrolase [Bacillota bacterium]